MKGSNSAHPTILIFFWSGRGNRTLLLQLRWESRGRRTDAVSPAAGTKPKQHSEVPTRYTLLHFVRVWIAAGNVWQGKNWVSGCLPSFFGGGGGGGRGGALSNYTWKTLDPREERNERTWGDTANKPKEKKVCMPKATCTTNKSRYSKKINLFWIQYFFQIIEQNDSIQQSNKRIMQKAFFLTNWTSKPKNTK